MTTSKAELRLAELIKELENAREAEAARRKESKDVIESIEQDIKKLAEDIRSGQKGLFEHE